MTSPLSDALSDAVCTSVHPLYLSFQVTSSRSRCMVVCITNVHTYVHACERAYLVCSTYTTESQAMHSYMCTTNFSSRKKQKSVSTVHYPLQQLVCVFVLTWSSKSSKSLKLLYLTQSANERRTSNSRIFERVLMKNQTNFSRIQPHSLILTAATNIDIRHTRQPFYQAIVGVGVGAIEVDRKKSSSTSFLPLHCIYLDS